MKRFVQNLIAFTIFAVMAAGFVLGIKAVWLIADEFQTRTRLVEVKEGGRTWA